MSAATYLTQIAFSATELDGLFKIGSSVLDGPDTLGHEFSVNYSGPYDNVTMECMDFHIRRGRPNQLQKIQAGSSDWSLLNKGRKYDPMNTNSPIYPNIRPMRPCQVLASTTLLSHTLFTGFTSEISGNPDWGAQEAKFVFEDFFLWMDRMDGPVISGGGGGPGETTTVGAAIGLVLDAVGWTNPVMRDLDVGSTIPGFEADGTKSALTLIDELLQADRGVFYIDKDGRAIYEDRYAKDLRTPQFTLANARFGQPGIAVRDIYNRARVTREGGVTQTYLDTVSKNEFGLADQGEITTPYLFTDADAMYLAKYLVNRTKDPSPLYWEIEVQEGGHPVLDDLLGLDLFDRITVTGAPTGGTGLSGGDYHVEQIEHWGEGGTLHRSKWTLSKAFPTAPFIIGVSELDSTDILTF